MNSVYPIIDIFKWLMTMVGPNTLVDENDTLVVKPNTLVDEPNTLVDVKKLKKIYMKDVAPNFIYLVDASRNPRPITLKVKV